MSLRHNDLVELSIEKPAAGGRMIARHEGQVVLVSGAIPGERVRARIERATSSVVYAVAEEILQRDPSRRTVRGDWTCGGQAYAFVEYPRQLELKRDVIRDAFARLGKMPLDGRELHVTGSSREDGYRMRARLHVAAGRIGFLREGTHEWCDAAATGQLLAETSRAIEQVSQRLKKIDPNAVASIELSENMAGDERALHFQLRPGPSVRTMALAPLAGVPGVTGATCQLASGAAAVRLGGIPLVGDSLAQILGREPARFGGSRLERQPRAFFQANRYLLATLVNAVLARLLPEGEVIDLYAGVGLFSGALAATGRDRIIAVEGDRVSGADLAMNAKRLGGAVACELQAVERYLATRTGDPAPTVILDPPRTGLSREAIDGVIAHGAKRLVYVSCDIATLARDVRRAVDAGYTLTHLEAFDLFPNTAHIETLAVLER